MSGESGSTIDTERVERIIAARLLMSKREAARQAKNYLLADEFRQKLNDAGVEVFDQKDGPSGWKFKDGTSKKLPAGAAVPVELEEPKKSKKRSADASSASAEVPNPEPKKLKVKSLERSTPAANDNSSSSSSSSNNASKLTSSTIAQKVSTLAAKEKDQQRAALNSVIGSAPNVKKIEGVIIEDVQPGPGPRKAQPGDKLKMNYTGRLKSNGKIFDSSIGKKPFTFKLGRGEVIRGWDIGCQGMAIGGKRILTIPPEKGYGRSGAPPTIPGNATLVFEIQLLGIN